MDLLQETFTETLDAGAPSIKYEGDIQQEQKVARTLWDQLPNQVRMRFGSFEQFFQSGAWKKVLEAVQQQQQMQAPEQIQETEVIQEQAPQQGLGSMMPAQMAEGGTPEEVISLMEGIRTPRGEEVIDDTMTLASASDPLDDKNQISYSLFGKPLHELTPDEEMMLDEWLEDKAQKWGGAYGGIAGADGRRAYGIGSFFKKIFKKVTKPIKKIGKSKLGKAALLYGLGTLAGGAGMFGGTGSIFNPSTIMSRLANPSNLLNLVKPSGWSQTNPLNALIRTKAKGGEYGGVDLLKTLGVTSTLAPFAMQAMGKWPEQPKLPIDESGKFDYNYQDMIRALQKAALSGDQDQINTVMQTYNLSPTDMPNLNYLQTAAQGGRIGALEGGLLKKAPKKKTVMKRGGLASKK